MDGLSRSMILSLLLFIVILSLMEMNREKLASSEPLTILGGLISSFLFLTMLTFIGNFQESSGSRTGWGAVALAETVALVAASTVHRVCITTCFLFSGVLLYEVDKLSGITSSWVEPKAKRH
ncbi:keratinocyte-associated-like protein [Wolffia australiana]